MTVNFDNPTGALLAIVKGANTTLEEFKTWLDNSDYTGVDIFGAGTMAMSTAMAIHNGYGS